ncbi:SDR family oxidoreductase [Intrasporangium mesophilum]
MRTAHPTVLLTGASGVVGRALIDELSRDHRIVCLRHRRDLADPRVDQVTGSLDEPLLGLTPHDYDRLTAGVDLVVHGGAATNWKASAETIRQINVTGTRAMLALAERAQAPMIYVSTAFVANPPGGANGEFASARAYIASKAEAEQATRDSAVQTVIVRPSLVIGDSQDGHMAAFQGLHRVAGLIAQGLVPLIACDEDALVDAVPQDVVAAAIGELIRERHTEGELWLTAGSTAMTAGDIVASSLRLGHALGLSPSAPRFIPAEAVNRLLLPLMADAISPELRQMFAELLEMTWLFQLPAALPTSLPGLGLGAAVTRQRLHSAFDLSLGFWADVKGLRPARADEDADLPELAS